MTIQQALRDAAHRLQQAGIDTATLDARLLMEHLLGVTREALLLQEERPLTDDEKTQFEILIAARCNRQPISHITGKREFWSMDFMVTKDTLTPRPDSETLVQMVVDSVPSRAKPMRILDLGTGTGCLLLALLSEFPQATGLGVDVSEAALAVAFGNAETLGLKNHAEFEKTDWNSTLSGVFDVVVSNPPYIPLGAIPTLTPEVAQYEPWLALDGGDDGLQCYRAIFSQLSGVLADDGLAALEIGAGQLQQVTDIVREQGFMLAQVRQDLAGIPRCIMVTKQG